MFLLIVGFFFLGETPSPMGILGCLIVLFGAYLIGIDSKNKQQLTLTRKTSDKEESEEENSLKDARPVEV